MILTTKSTCMWSLLTPCTSVETLESVCVGVLKNLKTNQVMMRMAGNVTVMINIFKYIAMKLK